MGEYVIIILYWESIHQNGSRNITTHGNKTVKKRIKRKIRNRTLKNKRWIKNVQMIALICATIKSILKKSQKVSDSHRKDMWPLTQDLNYRSACENLRCCIIHSLYSLSYMVLLCSSSLKTAPVNWSTRHSQIFNFSDELTVRIRLHVCPVDGIFSSTWVAD